MKVLFYLGHPAHYHLFKNVINNLTKDGHKIFILIKKKDILEDLLKHAGLKYQNILPKGRKDTRAAIAYGLAIRDLRLLRFSIKNCPNIMIGTSTEICHVGSLIGIPSINVNEDDFDVVPLYSKLTYPWASSILTPIVCKTGKWEYKSIKYEGYHELAYLHPNHFTPDKKIVEKYFNCDEPFFVLRFAKLTAHHDEGIKGINSRLAVKIVEALTPFGKVYITSERILEPQLERYRIAINPLDIHHVLSFAKLFIGDSQTMAAESGVLGTPFIRFNDFVGRIGYLDELENKYKLGVGISTSEPEKIFTAIDSFLNNNNLFEEWQEKRRKMLSDKIDVAKFITWFIENYPKSKETMKKNPDQQYIFR